MNSREVAATAIFTAFVAAATSVFSVYVPATTGYFNVGEIMVYTSALLMGPYVGAFAGGVGSMISDLSLGYPYYAPGTLVIKGIEGFVVGYLSTRAFPKVAPSRWKAITLLVGTAFAASLTYLGVTFLSGEIPLTLGGAWYLPSTEIDLQIPWELWVALGVAVAAVFVYFVLKSDPRSGKGTLSVLVGGSEMVAGYYLYESFVLTLLAPASVVATLAPAAEVPVNLAQMLIGLLVSVPLVRSIRRTVGRGPLKGPPGQPGN